MRGSRRSPPWTESTEAGLHKARQRVVVVG
jgi:hypothetical protein